MRTYFTEMIDTTKLQIFFISFVSCAFAEPMEVDILSIGLMDHTKTAISLAHGVPPMEMAIEKANNDYNGLLKFNLRLIYDRRHQSCLQLTDEMPDMVSQWYYKERRPTSKALSVIIYPGRCSSFKFFKCHNLN